MSYYALWNAFASMANPKVAPADAKYGKDKRSTADFRAMYEGRLKAKGLL